VIPPSLLNFLSGLAAGAGINLLTSVEGGSNAAHTKIVADSVIWVVAAIILAYAAQVVDGAEREAALVTDVSLSRQRRKDLLKDEVWRVRWTYRSAIAFATITSALAMFLVPGVGW
jgi:hypothetical protein